MEKNTNCGLCGKTNAFKCGDCLFYICGICLMLPNDLIVHKKIVDNVLQNIASYLTRYCL